MFVQLNKQRTKFPMTLAPKGELRTHMHHLVAPLSGRCGQKKLFQPSCDFLIFYAAFLLLMPKTSVFQAEDVAKVLYEKLAGAEFDRNVLSSDLTFYNLYIVR